MNQHTHNKLAAFVTATLVGAVLLVELPWPPNPSSRSRAISWSTTSLNNSWVISTGNEDENQNQSLHSSEAAQPTLAVPV
jgi:hypothetical protein